MTPRIAVAGALFACGMTVVLIALAVAVIFMATRGSGEDAAVHSLAASHVLEQRIANLERKVASLESKSWHIARPEDPRPAVQEAVRAVSGLENALKEYWNSGYQNLIPDRYRLALEDIHREHGYSLPSGQPIDFEFFVKYTLRDLLGKT